MNAFQQFIQRFSITTVNCIRQFGVHQSILTSMKFPKSAQVSNSNADAAYTLIDETCKFTDVIAPVIVQETSIPMHAFTYINIIIQYRHTHLSLKMCYYISSYYVLANFFLFVLFINCINFRFLII